MADGINRFDHWKDQTVGSIAVVCILYWISRGWRQDTIGTVISALGDWLGVSIDLRAYSQHDNARTAQLQASKRGLKTKKGVHRGLLVVVGSNW